MSNLESISTNVYFQHKDCFPSDVKVILESGQSVVMSELRIGDKVKTGRKAEMYVVYKQETRIK